MFIRTNRCSQQQSSLSPSRFSPIPQTKFTRHRFKHQELSTLAQSVIIPYIHTDILRHADQNYLYKQEETETFFKPKNSVPQRGMNPKQSNNTYAKTCFFDTNNQGVFVAKHKNSQINKQIEEDKENRGSKVNVATIYKNCLQSMVDSVQKLYLQQSFNKLKAAKSNSRKVTKGLYYLDQATESVRERILKLGLHRIKLYSSGHDKDTKLMKLTQCLRKYFKAANLTKKYYAFNRIYAASIHIQQQQQVQKQSGGFWGAQTTFRKASRLSLDSVQYIEDDQIFTSSRMLEDQLEEGEDNSIYINSFSVQVKTNLGEQPLQATIKPPKKSLSLMPIMTDICIHN